jgi:hypothetical protein
MIYVQGSDVIAYGGLKGRLITILDTELLLSLRGFSAFCA